MSTRPPAVHVEDVAKSFSIPRERVHTLKERVLHPLRRAAHDEFEALRGVSFTVEPGEFYGIVGRNGSGKSTLLKCLAGIYRTDRGAIYVDGRVSTFIELGVGFNPDLAAFDNVMLNATMLGLSTKEARRRYDRIIDFAELRDFQDLKIKNYSSGMLVRLAFSVMIQVDADILLIDEVLAVGDAAFSQKCFDEFGRIRRSGATVLLVTHDMSAVQRFCDRAMVMEHGKVVQVGDVDAVADKYLQLNFSEEARAEAAGEDGPVTVTAEDGADGPVVVRNGDGRAEILDAWVEDGNGARVEVAPTGSPSAICFHVRFHADVRDPVFTVGLDDSQGTRVFSGTNAFDGPSGAFAAGSEHIVHCSFQNFLAPDRYGIGAAVAPDGNGLKFHDKRERIASVAVIDARPRASQTALPYHVDVVPLPAPAEVTPVSVVAPPEAPRPLGTPIKGPTALGSDFGRLLRLTWTLAATDFKLRYFGSVLGYLWSLVQPLLLFGVLYIVFSVLLDFSGSEKYYPVALLAGIVMFNFIAEATSGSVRSIVSREPLVRKIEFPRLAVPLATVLTALFNYTLNLVPVFVFLLAAGGDPRWSWFELPVIVAILTLWLAGIAMFLSAMFVRYRDIEPIWSVVMQVLFYATPIFYTLDTVGQKTGDTWVGNLLMINPFAALLQQFRHAVIDPSHLSAAAAIGGTWRLAAPTLVIVLTVVVGWVVFSRMAPKVAEEL